MGCKYDMAFEFRRPRKKEAKQAHKNVTIVREFYKVLFNGELKSHRKGGDQG
jgi:hypothetical protein